MSDATRKTEIIDATVIGGTTRKPFGGRDTLELELDVPVNVCALQGRRVRLIIEDEPVKNTTIGRHETEPVGFKTIQAVPSVAWTKTMIEDASIELQNPLFTYGDAMEMVLKLQEQNLDRPQINSNAGGLLVSSSAFDFTPISYSPADFEAEKPVPKEPTFPDRIVIRPLTIKPSDHITVAAAYDPNAILAIGNNGRPGWAVSPPCAKPEPTTPFAVPAAASEDSFLRRKPLF